MLYFILVMISMKNEIKALIVFVVLLLSVGPVIYFFGGEETDNGEEPTIPELSYIVQEIKITGEIVELDDYLIYNGITDYNNPEYVNKTVFETIGLKEDVKITMQMNSGAEGGYSYHIKAKVPAGMTAQELGVKLAYNFRPFFIKTKYWPVIMGKVKLPEKTEISIGEETRTIDFKEDEVGLIALYWQKVGDTVQLYCPQIKLNREDYEYLGNLESCYDITPTEHLGLTETMIDEIPEKMVRKELEIKVIEGVYFETEEKADVTVDDIFDKLVETKLYNERTIKVRHEDDKFKVDADYIDEEKTTQFIEDILTGLGLKITDSFKEGRVALPYLLKVEEVTYDVRYTQLQTAKLHINDLPWETKEFIVYTKGKYGQLLQIRLEELGQD